MVFLSHSLPYSRDFHFTVEVCLRQYIGYTLVVEELMLILKPVLRISVFHQT